MILGRRRSAIEPLGIAVDTASVFDVTHRIHAFRLRGVGDDSAMHQSTFPQEAQLRARPTLSVLLEGRVSLRLGTTTHRLSAGDAYLIPAKSAYGWRLEPDVAGISFAWNVDADAAGEVRLFRVEAQALEVLRCTTARLFDESSAVDPKTAENIHASICDALRAIAPEIESPARTRCVPEYLALSRAIDRRLSDLAAEPMQIELQDELGIAERTLRRITTEMFQRYGFVDSKWVDARTRRRLTTAVAFLSHPNTTVTQVARAVGYHSPQAMSRAFARAGYPPPAQIREHFAELGRAESA